jgi:glycosyltransferase involved in cell wall biosynthesis
VFLDILFRKIDLYLTPSCIIPALLPPKRCILILCDITGILFLEYHTLKVRLLTKLTKIAISKAKLTLTISENSKNDIVSHFNVADHLVRVTYLAAAENFKVIDNSAYLNDFRIRHSLPDNYILFVGSIEPRKNLVGLIIAFDKIKTKIKHKLVIVGGKGWLNSEIYTLIKKKCIENRVIFTGYVSTEELVAFYNLADLFVYPSFYEGFGIPPLEAMACGTPVITSDTSSLPEVVGEAALKVAPKDTDALASSICRVLNDETLQNKMIQNGLSRAKEFSWHHTAAKTLQILEMVYATK